MTMPWRLEVHDALPSTSDLLKARAAAGAPDGLAILALRQTQGRGRDGRTWLDGAGNLALSVLLRPHETVAVAAGEWPLLAAVALHDAVAPLLPPAAALAVKWPNDLLADGRKLAGMLIETTLANGAAVDALVLGIGLNLAVAPAVAGRATAALADWTPPPAPAAAAALILDALWRRRAERARHGFAPIRAAWLDRAHPLGTALVAGGVAGIFAGLDADGALLLDTPHGLRRIHASEVWLAGEAPPDGRRRG